MLYACFIFARHLLDVWSMSDRCLLDRVNGVLSSVEIAYVVLYAR